MISVARGVRNTLIITAWSCIAGAGSLGLVGCASGGSDEADPTMPPPGENIVIPITVNNNVTPRCT